MATNGSVIERLKLMQREAKFLGVGETFDKSLEPALEQIEKSNAEARALRIAAAEAAKHPAAMQQRQRRPFSHLDWR